MSTQRAFRIHHDAQGHRAGVETLAVPAPADGEVLIRVGYSGVNYKDALAGTGKGKVIKRFPITGGIDAAGVVETSLDARFQPGDAVIATGWGLAFDHDGGYAQFLCVPGDWLVPMPAGLDPRAAMLLGTAGFTAALAVQRLLVNGQTPEMGPILVTGASGGVGSIAIAILARLGFEVAAVSGKAELQDWLTTLGATRILGRDALPGGDRPLEQAVWGGAIDNVGGAMLAQITRTVVPYGNIAAVGLAGGTALNTTVMPFILRGVGLLGCDSVHIAQSLRNELWQHLASDWRPADLDAIRSDSTGLDGLPAVFERMLAGQTHGRVLVELG
ncbi:YhdH/YhfP family quinone oxidoreductase [Thiohalocapsa marina]|uniref:YhdH/YhfP family quinone oxidoreductase n=1 Tax=Thiohalocapsa marina TaxID=424902 RepID=A0A5M8FLS8_9GAMM|nr:YhdH/YhfP family quinone oxidoreductase [Thiohalocapsa marina]KAA6185883.1 YhdH/YhfP family quinone oxidoreductase [Thiohalocapsa marina]